jgi:hypothetical protein
MAHQLLALIGPPAAFVVHQYGKQHCSLCRLREKL